MAVVTIGRIPNASGPDLAVCYANQQLVSASTNYAAQTITLTTVSFWAGIYSGSPIVRAVLYWDHPDGRPGGVARRTVEVALDTGYTGGGGGKKYTLNLESPLAVPANHRLWVGIVTRNGDAGVAMIGSGAISEPNENMYRKSTSGTNPVDGVGSTIQAGQGQLMIGATGETGSTGGGGTGAPGNSIPYAPEILSSGALTPGDLSPNLSFRHRDPDGNNSSKAHIEVRRVGETELKWDYTWNIVVANNTVISRTYAGTALAYSTDFEWRAQTWDSNGNEGPFSPWTTFRVNQANVAPDPPTIVSPIGDWIGQGLRPALQMRHHDDDGNSATRARMRVRLKGQTALKLNVEWATSVANNGIVGRTYDGAELTYYDEYEWQGETYDGQAWSQPSPWTTFTLFHTNQDPHPAIVQPPFPEGFTKPSDASTIGFTWVFQDPDALLPGMFDWERTSAVRIVIREKGSNTNWWDSGEMAAHFYHNQSINVKYTGPTLQYNKDYNVYYIHKDRRGREGDWVTRTMRFSTGGVVSEPRLPKGRTTNHANPGNVFATYTEQNGLAANAAQMRVVSYSDDPAVVASGEYRQLAYSDLILTAWNSGQEISLAWGGIGYSVPQGETIGVQVRARIASSNELTDWSPPSWITGNAPPSVPRPVAPEHGRAFSSKPTLSVEVNDIDQPPSELSVKFRLFDNAQMTGTPIILNGVRRAGGTNNTGDTATFDIDLSSQALVLGTEYWWDAYSRDGYLWSGGSTAEASASKSTPRSFIYDSVPTVTITSPTTVGTLRPTFTWTTNQSQTKYQVRLTNSSGVVVYDSGEVTSSDLFHTFDPANLVEGYTWENGTSLSLVVGVHSNLWGYNNPPVSITLSYVLPATPASVIVSAFQPEGHAGNTAIAVTHDPTTYGPGVFYAYRYYRTPIAGPGGSATGPRILLSTNTGATEPRLEDWTIESGQWYRYDVTQVTVSGVDQIESLAMSGEAMGSWSGVVLSLPYRPDTYNVHLRLAPPGRPYEVTVTRRDDKQTIGASTMRRRVAAFGRRREIDAKASFSLWGDRATGLTGQQLRDRLLTLMDCANGVDSPDGSAHIVCWREGRGGRDSVLYGTFSDSSDIVVDGRNRDLWIADLTLEDADFVLGEGV